MAFQMLGTILLGTFLGRFFDQKLQNRFPAFTLIGVLSGIGIAMFRVLKSLDSNK